MLWASKDRITFFCFFSQKLFSFSYSKNFNTFTFFFYFRISKTHIFPLFRFAFKLAVKMFEIVFFFQLEALLSCIASKKYLFFALISFAKTARTV